MRTGFGKELPLPHYQTEFAAGLDLYAAIEETIILAPHGRTLIRTGIKVQLPPDYEMQIRPRSGLALKHGITVLNSPGTIDADYRGEVGVILINHSEVPFCINKGDRIAQAVISAVAKLPMVEVDALDESERGEGGFGSTTKIKEGFNEDSESRI